MREKLAYVVDSTAAPISVIIPFSTWSVFFSGLIVANGIAPEGEGLSTYIGAVPYMLYAWVAVLLVPTIIFVSMGLVSFMTGSNWGVFVIILPIVTTLANNLGADMTLVIGATLSASTFGSHACFYSDATVLTAQATGCTPMQHALTQIPYALIAAFISVLGYLVLGYL